jgi:HSP20 family molecular chaperone IbpA
MRYRRLGYRRSTTMIVDLGHTWPFADVWQQGRIHLLLQGRWRPDADMYETAAAVEILVDLAGVDEDDVEVQLFDDAVVVEGQRQLPAGEERAVYHAASIRQGPFRLELPLPAAIDHDRVDARRDRGLLRITLPKRRPSP